MKSIRIVGGGLAGLSLGIALCRHNVPVELHEAGCYPRHRVCGEFISGVQGQTLAELGIEKCLADARQCHDTIWYRGRKEICRAALPSAAFAISRYRLDARLAEEFEGLGGVLKTNSRIAKPEEGQLTPGTVWASGRQLEQSEWFGLKFHCRGLQMESDLEMHMGNGSYLGIVAIEDGLYNVCGLFKKQKFRVAKKALAFAYLEASKLSSLVPRFQAAEILEESIMGVSHFNYSKPQARGGYLSIGDANALIPPFTGNGMSLAFESAQVALKPLIAYSRNHQSWKLVNTEIAIRLRESFSRRLAIARFLHYVIYQPMGQTVFSQLARLKLLPFKTLFRLTH